LQPHAATGVTHAIERSRQRKRNAAPPISHPEGTNCARAAAAHPSRRPESEPANPDLAAGRSSRRGAARQPKAADLAVVKEDGAGKMLTTNQGTRVNDNQNT
jgi:hypothetical protein